MAKKRKKSRGKKVLLSALCVVLGLVLAVLIGGTVWVNSFLNQIDREDAIQETLSDEQIQEILNETEPEDVEFTGEVIDPEDIELGDKAEVLLGEEDHMINILLIFLGMVMSIIVYAIGKWKKKMYTLVIPQTISVAEICHCIPSVMVCHTLILYMKVWNFQVTRLPWMHL